MVTAELLAQSCGVTKTIWLLAGRESLFIWRLQSPKGLLLLRKWVVAKSYGSVRRVMTFIKKHYLVVIYSRRRGTFICPERRKDVKWIESSDLAVCLTDLYNSLLHNVVYTATLYPSQGF